MRLAFIMKSDRESRTLYVLANNLQVLDNVLPSVLMAKTHNPEIRIVLVFAHRPRMVERATLRPSVELAFNLADEILIPSGSMLRSYRTHEAHKIKSENTCLSSLNKIRTLYHQAGLDLTHLLSSLESSGSGPLHVWFDFWSTESPMFRKILISMTLVRPPASFVGFGHGLSFSSEKEQQFAINAKSLISSHSPKSNLTLYSGNPEFLSKGLNGLLVPQPNHRWSKEWIDFVNLHCGLETEARLKDREIGLLVSRPVSRNPSNPWGPSPKTKAIVERDVLDVFKELSLDPFFLKHPNERARTKSVLNFNRLNGVHPLAAVQRSRLIVSYGSSIGVDCNRLGGHREIVYRPDFHLSANGMRYPSSRGIVVTTKEALRQLAMETLNLRPSAILQKAECVPNLLS